MYHCSMPFPRLVFCSHLQCVQCLHYVDDDGYPIGDKDCFFPSDDFDSLSDIRNYFADLFVLLKLLRS